MTEVDAELAELQALVRVLPPAAVRLRLRQAVVAQLVVMAADLETLTDSEGAADLRRATKALRDRWGLERLN